MSVRARSQASTNDNGERLLAEVYRDPIADAPRQVYADWLLQRGDPRGELIALQLSGTNPRRAKQLVKRHVRQWLGPIAPIVRDPVFERGFLAACTVEADTPQGRDLLVHPSWATVTRIVTYDPHPLESPAMKSLRCARGLIISDIAKLAARKEPLGIEALEQVVVNRNEDGDDWAALYDVGAFLRLHELGVAFDEGADVAFDSWKWLLSGKLGKRLTRLQVDMSDFGVPDIPDWMRAFATTRTLQTLELIPDGESSLRIDRAARRFQVQYHLLVKTSGADIEWRYGRRATAQLFAGFPVKAAPHLDISLHAATKAADVASAQAFFEHHFAKRFASVSCRARSTAAG
jgi:uncharacterized protein (TIGR02996 family)